MTREWLQRIGEKPLVALTLIALFPRVVAAFFSGGFFALDDHFLVIEQAASWVEAPQISTWLPWNQGEDPRPSGHSFFYVGLHFLLFTGLKAIGLVDPEALMVVVRLLHAVWSLVVVRVGYRIALRLSDAAIAWRTGLFLALFYFMPFLSVRNLVEVACIPFLMLGSWQLVRSLDRPTLRAACVAGLWLGMAMNVRFQTVFFAAGPGLVMLFQRRWAQAFAYGAGVAAPLALVQGGIDLFMWGRPFAELTEYVVYNMANTTTYGVLPWYNYLLLLAGMLIPPMSLAVLFGFFRRPAPLLIWMPLVLFLVIHSYFPNKQERFLLPMVPLFFVVGHAAWEHYRLASAWWRRRNGLWRGSVRFVQGLNAAMLVVLCFSYSKRSRVEAMVALQHVQDVRGVVIEDTYRGTAPILPLFYSGKWKITIEPWTDPKADLGARLAAYPEAMRPNVVLFIGEEDLAARIARTTAGMGRLEVIHRAQPGALDRLVHWLNPVNRNETILVAITRPQRGPARSAGTD